MRLGLEEAHAAQLAHQMRRLREGDGAQPPADAVAHLEQPHPQCRLFVAQAPGGVGAGHATAHDRHVEIGGLRARAYGRQQ